MPITKERQTKRRTLQGAPYEQMPDSPRQSPLRVSDPFGDMPAMSVDCQRPGATIPNAESARKVPASPAKKAPTVKKREMEFLFHVAGMLHRGGYRR